MKTILTICFAHGDACSSDCRFRVPRVLPRLIATWKLDQDPATDAPISLHWDDDARTPADAADFARILSHTQSDPEIENDCVSFGYDVKGEN